MQYFIYNTMYLNTLKVLTLTDISATVEAITLKADRSESITHWCIKRKGAGIGCSLTNYGRDVRRSRLAAAVCGVIIQMHAYLHVNKHTHVHMHMHTHTHTQTHIHSQTHTQSLTHLSLIHI